MRWWQVVGIVLAPLKHAAFYSLALFHKTTRPRIALLCGDEVLLVQNWGETKWSLPGGGTHSGETPVEAAIREVREELGIALTPQQLMYIDTFELKTFCAPVFVVQLEYKPTITRQKLEIYSAKWFPKEALPPTTALLRKLSF